MIDSADRREADAREKPRQPTCALPASRELRVLLADDDPETRRRMTIALRTRGHDVVEVSGGLGLLYQALFGWRDVFDKPDVIVCEAHLAGWNTFEVMDWLRGAAVRTPYVFITESDDAPSRSEARRRGASALKKPIDLDDLCKMVDSEVAE